MKPNIIIIFADDLGYGDVSCFGQRHYKTPAIDSIAQNGVKFTDFYVSQPVCSASRASLLTGCYPNRIGIAGALDHMAKHGLNHRETTIAEILKAQGYATAMVGKWHLGHHRPFLPIHHGFDEYLGLPYSNDMWPNHPTARVGYYPPLPLIDGDRVVDTITPEKLNTLTERYTERAVQFIENHRDAPFFLYVAHTMPHVPLGASEKFRGRSGQGLYADVITEIDAAVGEILATLKRHDLTDNTLVIFTSDNGPWLSYGTHAGTSGPLREGKGTCWEGGVREPFVAQWPGKIPKGSVCTEPVMTIDLLPTLAKIVQSELPTQKIDGKDIGDLLLGKKGARSPQEAYYFYYGDNQLRAVRSGRWKLILPHAYQTLPQNYETPPEGRPIPYTMVTIEKPELYDLKTDIGEKRNVATKHPKVVAQLLRYAESIRTELGDGPQRPGKATRPPAFL
jgi:arylsulfatase A